MDNCHTISPSKNQQQLVHETSASDETLQSIMGKGLLPGLKVKALGVTSTMQDETNPTTSIHLTQKPRAPPEWGPIASAAAAANAAASTAPFKRKRDEINGTVSHRSHSRERKLRIIIDTEAAKRDGISFRRHDSDHTTIITDGLNQCLPVKYFEKVIDVESGHILHQNPNLGAELLARNRKFALCDETDCERPRQFSIGSSKSRKKITSSSEDNYCSSSSTSSGTNNSSGKELRTTISSPANHIQLIHGTYLKNIANILVDGLVPNVGSATSSAPHRRHTHHHHIHTVLAESHVAKSYDGIPGLRRAPDVKLYIDPRKIDPAGLFRRTAQLETQSASTIYPHLRDPNTILIKGYVPAEAIVAVEANVPDEVPADMRATVGDPRDFNSIPVVDLGLSNGCFLEDSSLPSSQPPGNIKSYREENELVREIWDACRGPGFMQIRNHGISREELHEVTISSAKLFAISSAMKAKIHQKCSKGGRGYFGKAEENLDILEKDENSKRKKLDNKEGFDMGNDRNTIDDAFFGAPNLFPPEDAIPGFREWADRYHNVLVCLARHILRLMSIALDLPRQFFDGLTTAPVSTLRLLHYWPLMDFKREIGCGAHTDYGLVTLLLQDDVGGLQVLNKLSGEWIHVPPIEGALVVNLGDMMQRWTSNVFKSTIHRVVNVANVDRFSCPFFFNPNIDAEITPISTPKVLAAIEEERVKKQDSEDRGLDSLPMKTLTCEEILKGFYRRAGLL